ncbi:hypothetical protein Saso_25550 [Streptomyces asoensis]|uniref:Uncharacterized protein n=1 Tax=Streptomyces asoensis TaxID=249586 RepID=A0ABQ3RYF6_9ACTN|nr:hypothetical protein GCM10010496_18140 [Streptomyces asoensis]GHI60905.1 hypothetical protein Saso_25550 [Streptomyces asoensis]
MGTGAAAVKEREELNVRKLLVGRKFSRTSGQPRRLALRSSAPVGAVPSVDAPVTVPHCKESLMRHPAPSSFPATARADSFVAGAAGP